jgi:xylulose-5-phosphate/fructose-6-phosphate phosphoketolase
MQLAILNQIDRFSIAIDVVQRVLKLSNKAGSFVDEMKNMQIKALEYAYNHGVDMPELDE